MITQRKCRKIADKLREFQDKFSVNISNTELLEKKIQELQKAVSMSGPVDPKSKIINAMILNDKKTEKSQLLRERQELEKTIIDEREVIFSYADMVGKKCKMLLNYHSSDSVIKKIANEVEPNFETLKKSSKKHFLEQDFHLFCSVLIETDAIVKEICEESEPVHFYDKDSGMVMKMDFYNLTAVAVGPLEEMDPGDPLTSEEDVLYSNGATVFANFGTCREFITPAPLGRAESARLSLSYRFLKGYMVLSVMLEI